MALPANTWRGILEHLAGLRDFSGHNGLATFAYAKPNVDAVLADISWRERYYGGKSTGVSQSVSVKIPLANPAFSASVGTKIGGLEVNGGLKGEYDLVSLFKRGRSLLNKAQQLKALAGPLDALIRAIPDIKVSGDAAIYVGMTSHHVWYTRLQTGVGISFKVFAPIPKTNIRGVSVAGGRSWQIQLAHWYAYMPHDWSY